MLPCIPSQPDFRTGWVLDSKRGVAKAQNVAMLSFMPSLDGKHPELQSGIKIEVCSRMSKEFVKALAIQNHLFRISYRPSLELRVANKHQPLKPDRLKYHLQTL